MTIYAMRHAHAVPEDTHLSDAERYLSDHGRASARGSSQWLREQQDRPSLIVSSPLARAVQTAELVASVLEVDRVVILGALTTPAGSSRRAADWLRAQDEHALAVGHEPLISGVVAYLVGESELPALFPAQILAIRDGRVIGASPAVKSPAGAPSSRGAPPSRG